MVVLLNQMVKKRLSHGGKEVSFPMLNLTSFAYIQGFCLYANLKHTLILMNFVACKVET